MDEPEVPSFLPERRQPAPELAAEAKAFTDQIAALLDHSGEKPDMLQFTIRVPRELALMAAWIMFKEDLRRDGVPTVLPRPVRLHLDDGRRGRDWDRAKAYFQRAIFYEFDTDYTNLLMLEHPLLYPLPPEPPKPDRLSEELDDDIPF